MHVSVLVLLARAAASLVEESEWAAFKYKYGKSYANASEELRRATVYADNRAYIDRHNTENAAGKHSFTLGVNRFADLTVEEWRATYANLLLRSNMRDEIHQTKGEVADGVDWRQYGVVTDVKNQGHCASSWSFATTGSLEGAWALAGNSLTSFSEQQLVDCSGYYGNQGCSGGSVIASFEYIRDMGIATEASYTYTARDGQCRAFSPVGSLSSFDSVSRGSERALADAVARHGPVAVAIDASHRSFQLYNSGIYDEWQCSSTHLNHGALVVGYGDGYWLVKNSWGTDWGEAGYIRMTKDGGNQCGIATQASYPRI